MARVALVTGGTRGIGAAISKALKAAGYKVAASYAGNDAAAGRSSRPRPASPSTNGTSAISMPAPKA
ncbi:NAD(P)-dependent dehydrogenase (short-subunit alcohol dehydrogenase family) [Bradyrhizobium sp. i1.3.6]